MLLAAQLSRTGATNGVELRGGSEEGDNQDRKRQEKDMCCSESKCSQKSRVSRAFRADEEGRNENNPTSNEAKWHHREAGEEIDRQSPLINGNSNSLVGATDKVSLLC